MDDLRQVEAKYPALLFKQQLTAFLEKIYGMIRDNLKKEISPLIGLCIQVRDELYSLVDPILLSGCKRDCFLLFLGIYTISCIHCLYILPQAPRTSRASMVKGRSQANAVAQQALIAHWQSIVKNLNNYLKTMRANYVSASSIIVPTIFLFIS